MNGIVRAILYVCVMVLVCVGCNSSPTVPLPPPEMTMIIASSPDQFGNVTVRGEAGVTEYGDVVLIFNDDTGAGAMKESETDGSFEVGIQAEVDHILVIQFKRGQRLSEEGELVVE